MDNTNRNTKGWSSVVGGRMQEQINNFRYIAGFMYLHFSLFGSVLVNEFWTPPPPINFVHDHLFFSKFIIIYFFVI